MAGAAAVDPHAADYEALARVQSFLQWLSRALLASLYPGAPFERKHFALELLLELLDTWADVAWPAAAAVTAGAAAGGAAGARDDAACGAARAGMKSEGSLDQAAGKSEVDERRRPLLLGFQPFDEALLSKGATTTLIGGVVDTWDKLRAGEGGLGGVQGSMGNDEAQCRNLGE